MSVDEEFVPDSPLEEAVMSEPVSEGAPFPGNWEKYRETQPDPPYERS